MTMQLSGPSAVYPNGASPRRLVVLLHGLGADGNDLFGLAPAFAPALPETAFVSPDAPFPCDMAPYGRQWFSLQTRDPAAILAGVKDSARILDGFLDDMLEKYRLDDSKLALVGFSQGCMMSLYVGPRRAKRIAGIVGYSGRLVGDTAEFKSKPPMLLVHGDADQVVPPDSLPLAVAALEKAGVPVEAVARPGLGHGIDPIGLERGRDFLVKVLG
ncbi:MAG TPA: alpha/beta fold hydrolase [Stellaceae bacterium]|jgi:phospholipase/carboxylesterase